MLFELFLHLMFSCFLDSCLPFLQLSYLNVQFVLISRLLEQEQERLRQELRQAAAYESSREHVCEAAVPRIKLKWKAQKGDPNNGGYNADILQNILSCYGQINALIVSSKRGGSAIVEFEDSGVSSDILDETGLKENPFTIVWLSGKPVTHKPASMGGGFTNDACVDSPSFTHCSFVGENIGASEISNGGGGTTNHAEYTNRNVGVDKDYESIVLMKMRQAEERKRLMEQMKKEDEENG